MNENKKYTTEHSFVKAKNSSSPTNYVQPSLNEKYKPLQTDMWSKLQNKQ